MSKEASLSRDDNENRADIAVVENGGASSRAGISEIVLPRFIL